MAKATLVLPLPMPVSQRCFCASVPCLARMVPTIAGDTTMSSSAHPAASLRGFAEQGSVMVVDLLAPRQLAALLEGLSPFLDASAPLGRNDFEGLSTNRVYALLAKVPAMAPLVEHPHVLAMLDALLEP